jgi:hypothetical protein
MDTRALMWIILGAILVLGGVVSSLEQGKEAKSREPRPEVLQSEAPLAVEKPARKDVDTGFVIDPIKGLKRKDENAEYFK